MNLNVPATLAVLTDVLAERHRQHARWGEQSLPFGTGGARAEERREWLREECDLALRSGRATWAHVLNEEVAEALAETEPAKLRAELIQVAAVAVQAVEHLDRTECRTVDPPPSPLLARFLRRLVGPQWVRR